MGYQNPVSDKQLRYIEALAREAGLGGDAWDHFPGWSRSKAQKKATSRDASNAIEALQAKIALNEAKIALNEKRAGKIDGDVVDGHLRLAGGEWIKLKPGTLAVHAELAPQLVGRWDAVATRRAELKTAGDEAPIATAMRQIAGVPAKTAREIAIEQIRELMAEHSLTATDLA